MTPDQIVDNAQQILGNPTGASVTDAWFLSRVNEAYKWLGTLVDRFPEGNRVRTREFRFPELFDYIQRTITASPSDNFVANSTGVWSVYHIYNETAEITVKRKTPRTLMRKNPADSEGTIRMWAPYAQSGSRGYLIWRIPDTNQTLREYVYKAPETLTSGGSAPVIDVLYHDIIAYKAAAFAADLLGMADEADRLHMKALNETRSRKLPTEDVNQETTFYYVMNRGT